MCFLFLDMIVKEMNDINSVKLKKEEHFNVKKCILCQKGSKKDVLTGTDNGRAKVISAVKILDNQKILNCSTRNSFVYHLHPRYSSYLRQEEQPQEKDAGNTTGQSEDNVMEESGHDVGSYITRSQTGTISSPMREIYIVCSCTKKYNDTKLYRIENDQRAWKFLAATNFHKDDAHQRSTFCNELRDVFAAYIRYHGNCLNKYILQASHELEKINCYNTKANSAIHDKQVVVKVFEEFCSKMDLSYRGYTSSQCSEKIN